MDFEQILIDYGYVNQGQLEEALYYTEKNGGEIEDHLLRLGYLNEKILAEAVSKRNSKPVVLLSKLFIDPELLKFIPKQAAYEYLLLPLLFDIENNKLTLACENPDESSVRELLDSYLTNVSYELVMAVKPVLKCKIIENYRGIDMEKIVELNDQIHQDQDTDHKQKKIISEIYDADNELSNSFSKVLILDETKTAYQKFKESLQLNFFTAIVTETIDQFIKMSNHTVPDQRIIIVADNNSVSEYLKSLNDNGYHLTKIPTFLLTNEIYEDQYSHALRDGFEDVLLMATVPDSLLIKMSRIRDRLIFELNQRLSAMKNLGTHGSLEDMNVIDLIQAMGPAEKTVMISVTANAQILTLYLSRGNIIYAECEEKIGADAIFEAIHWKKGIWNIEHITHDQLPEPNNIRTNDSILLEGCTLLDEKTESESQKINTAESFFDANL